MRRRFGRFLFFCLHFVTAGLLAGQAVGEELPGYGGTTVQRVVMLGQPQPTLKDPFLPPVGSVQQAQSMFEIPSSDGSYITRRFDELPPPIDQGLPLPSYEKLDRMHGRKANPFTVDYIFIGRAGVDAPATNVKMSEVAMMYEHHWPYRDRWLFTFRPVADVLFLSGPGGTAPDLPEQLYKVAIDVQADFQITPRIGLSLGITPGLWTDFRRVSGDDVRVPARLLATYSLWDGLFLAGGVVWTDNFYRNLLPGVGVIWEITDRTKLELLWPRSRLGYRWHDTCEIYGVFERGGNTYNIRVNDIDEDFQYRDLRLMLGIQSDFWSRASLFAEAGIAFDRRFRFEVQPDFDIKRAFLFRVGAKF